MTQMNAQPVKQLRRTKDGRIIAGVCSGIGEYFGVDPNILRIALAVMSFFGGLGIGIYAVAWLLVPEEGKTTSILQDLIGKQMAKGRENWWHQAPPESSVPSQTPAPSQESTGPRTVTGSPGSSGNPRPSSGGQP